MNAKALKQLFDYQKFEGNEALDEVIQSVHARYGMAKPRLRELTLDEMEWVAAGASTDEQKQEQKKDEHI